MHLNYEPNYDISLQWMTTNSDSKQKYPSKTLVSFSTNEFRRQQHILSKSAISVGIERIILWSEEKLRDENFFQAHRYIFDQKRGFGCWLWKPYIIHRELSKLGDEEFLIYWDVGRRKYPHRFELSIEPLLDWCLDNGGMLPGVCVPQYGPNKRWTKRDCFVAMNCDSAMYWEHPQVQATFSIWQKSSKALSFVDEWLTWCQRPEVITDDTNRLGLPDFDQFVAHRHDQSVLTNLVIKHHLRYFGPGSSVPGDGDKDINNAIDRILRREDRIKWREFRKPLQVWRYKLTDRTWWDRKKLSDRAWWQRRFRSALTLTGPIGRKLT
jgi:hypothetical protein